MKILRLALIVGMLSNSACSTLPPAQRSTTADATHSYIVAGQGSPTVILESGLGDGKDSWVPVINQIARHTRVFAYDRAGYGFSKSVNSSRDGATIIRELRSTLKEIGLRPPYVLVGHSVGGTYMELYARVHPEEVAGVVFVDSRHADFTRQCQQSGARSCSPPAVLKALMRKTPKRELADGEKTMDAVMDAGAFPDVPLVVLTSGSNILQGARFREVWLETQKSLATLSSDATHTICRRCGHYIHRDDPNLVIEAVNSVVHKSRRNQTAGE